MHPLFICNQISKDISNSALPLLAYFSSSLYKTHSPLSYYAQFALILKKGIPIFHCKSKQVKNKKEEKSKQSQNKHDQEKIKSMSHRFISRVVNELEEVSGMNKKGCKCKQETWLQISKEQSQTNLNKTKKKNNKHVRTPSRQLRNHSK